MNHPSDYMIHSHSSSSSDSSDTSFTLPPPLLNAKQSSQFFHHLAKEQKFSAKKKGKIKSNKQFKKNCKKGKGEKQQKRSVSDYLILGNSYYPCKNAVQVSNRIIQKQSARIMKNDRVKNKQKKCISKIEKYIKTFLINNHKNNLFRQIGHMQKIQLYQILKQQRIKQHEQQQDSLQQLMRSVVCILENKTDKLETLYPEHQQVLIKWKNFKLHQLMTAKMFINKEQHKLSEEILDFKKELPLLENAQFYPELKEQIIQLQTSILNHIQHKSSIQNLQNWEDEGLKWVLQKLLYYILGKPDIHEQILQKLHEFHLNQSLNVPLLSDDLYINFEKEQIETGDTELEEHTCIHIFNKAIFDLINQQFGHILETIEGNLKYKSVQWLFSRIKIRQKERQLPLQALLWVDQVIFDVLLEQSLWEFLDLL